MDVNGKQYNGAMTPFEGLLTDREIAGVLTYVKNSFGNQSGTITPKEVKSVRARMKGKPHLKRYRIAQATSAQIVFLALDSAL